MNERKHRKSMIIVAGMHRSGTSAVTRCLNICGASLPSDLLRPVKNDNDLGFWESQSIMEFHDEVLASIGGAWSSLNSIPEEWFKSQEATEFKDQLKQIIRDRFDETDLAIAKDPRISKLVPLWQAALAEMGITPKYVICIRNPFEVVQSLIKRNKFGHNYSLSLWFIYLRTLERQTRKLNRVFVDYDDLLNNPQKLLKNIDKTLTLGLNCDWASVQKGVESFLDASKRHHAFSVEELISKRSVPHVVKYFYSWLRSMASLESEAEGIVDQLNLEKELEKYSETEFVMFLQNIESLDEQLNHGYVQLKSHRESTNQQVEKDKTTKTRLVRMNESLYATQAELEEKREEVNSLVEQRRSLIKQHVEDVQKEISVANQRLVVSQKENSFLKVRVGELGRDHAEKTEEIEQLRSDKLELHSVSIRVEKALSDIQMSVPLRLGLKLVGMIRCLRLSPVGKLLLFFKALITFNLRDYLRMQARLKVVRESGLFNAKFYLNNYPLIRHSIRSPLEHYVGHGEREGRLPNFSFNPYFYSQQIQTQDNIWHSPLVHYIKEGADNNFDPSPEFSTKLYRKKLQLPYSVNPLFHYLDSSCAETDARNEVRSETGNPSGAEGRELSRLVSTALNLEVDLIIDEVEQRTLNEKLTDLNFERSWDNQTPMVSIVIPFFNKLEYTVNCMCALAKQSFSDYEVILIDDASGDEIPKSLSSIRGLTYIRNEKNMGYLKSCNKAAESAKGEFILQLNNDTLPLDGWLENLVNTFTQRDNVGVAGSLMLGQDGRVQEAGGIIFNDASGYNFGRGRRPEISRLNYCREVDYCSGASILIKREVWEKLGGYDERFAPAYYEDADFALAASELGYNVIFNPFSKLVHYEGVSSGNNLQKGVKRYQDINKKKFYKKWSGVLSKRQPLPGANDVDRYVRNQVKKGWILWIDSNTPTPDKDAGSIETVHFFERALKDGWGVTFMAWDAFRHEGRYTRDLQYMGVECIHAGAGAGEAKTPIECLQRASDSYNVVVLSRATVAKAAYPHIKSHFPESKVIFNTVDLHFLRYEREMELMSKFPNANLSARSQKVDKEEEISLVRSCDATIVVSEVEAQILRDSVPSANVKVIPLFGDVVGRNKSYEQRLNIGFIGGYQHPPNVDAVKYFVAEIWPLVQNKIPDCKFIIAGSNVSDEISKLASKSVEVRGFVPSAQDFMEEVRVMVAPLRYGAGIKGKIVSALCFGVPQVVTKEASEGMGLEHERDILESGSEIQFADMVFELYNDKAKWELMSGNATLAAERLYSKRALSGKISELLNELLE